MKPGNDGRGTKMAADEFQKERPQIQKEPSPANARSETRLPQADENCFRHPDPVRNRMALIAFWLGVLCLIPPVLFAHALSKLERAQGLFGVLLYTNSYGRWAACALGLAWVLGPAALIFGISGVRYRNRRQTAGGLGYAIFGIVLGTLLCLLSSSCIGFGMLLV
jgi:hypothetical protein